MGDESDSTFAIGQRVHSVGDSRRIGTVKYVGPIQGYSGDWVGVDWDNGDGKNDGSVNGVRYFQAKSDNSASFVRPKNVAAGITLLEALVLRYRGESTKEEEDLKELDLTGNLFSKWKDVAAICQELPALVALNLSNNRMAQDLTCLPILRNIRVLVLNYTGLKWAQVESLKDLLPSIEELHLMGNEISEITPTSSKFVQGFSCLRVLNLEANQISEWGEIVKLSALTSLEQLHLNKNNLSQVFYPTSDSTVISFTNEAFKNLCCLLLGDNNISDVDSVDSLNSFPRLTDVRLSGNPVADPGKGGIPRFVLIARLSKVETLNGSEVKPRERKESEIRYVRSVMSKFHNNQEEVRRCHPRFYELQSLHGLQDERPSKGAAGPQKMGSGLLTVTLKCVGASFGEKPPLTKKLPATTTVGKLKILCESFFKLKSIKLKLFLQEEGSPLPILLDNEMESLLDAGVSNESIILVDEEC